MKQKTDFKRRRKHGRLAKTKQQVYEERVDRAQNLGTYQTGIAMVEEQQQETRQSSNPATKAKAGNKGKVCNKCGESGHATWRVKACVTTVNMNAIKKKTEAVTTQQQYRTKQTERGKQG